MLRAAASFSWVASRVTLTGQPALSPPSLSASLWIRPSGEAAYTKLRSGSAIGLAVVICDPPAQRAIPAGVNVHTIFARSASIATVRP